MLRIDKLNASELNGIRVACAYLFSPQHARNDEFLSGLESGILTAAFRRKAKMYHPDLHLHKQDETLARREERFKKIQGSYEIMRSYFQVKNKQESEKGNSKKKVIAVGGAKGGIGKSLFVTNLGVFLSKKGYKTVIVDLDLGGANQHLYLGETYIKRSINDFISREVRSLQEITIKSKYGPQLVGGDSSQLGAANIKFVQKLSLLKAIKQIDADYVIVDLGGDTTFNIIDFFIAADHRIVMTSCDPASYLDAYNFIKTALYRKLSRLFGPESEYRHLKNNLLEDLISESILSSNGSKVKTIKELIQRVKTYQSQNLRLIKDVLSSFSPNLIVNRVEQNFKEDIIVKRIQSVSKKSLSIDVRYLGSIPYLREIELSTRDLVPIVTKNPQGILINNKLKLIYNSLKYWDDANL
ncbi:AAA family ATPase [Thermodesulfobacteriota bacterium]